MVGSRRRRRVSAIRSPAASADMSAAMAGRPNMHGPHCRAPASARWCRIRAVSVSRQPPGRQHGDGSDSANRPCRKQIGGGETGGGKDGQVDPAAGKATDQCPPGRRRAGRRQDRPDRSARRDLDHAGSRYRAADGHQRGAGLVGGPDRPEPAFTEARDQGQLGQRLGVVDQRRPAVDPGFPDRCEAAQRPCVAGVQESDQRARFRCHETVRHLDYRCRAVAAAPRSASAARRVLPDREP